jgi:hypothetical protein
MLEEAISLATGPLGVVQADAHLKGQKNKSLNSQIKKIEDTNNTECAFAVPSKPSIRKLLTMAHLGTSKDLHPTIQRTFLDAKYSESLAGIEK